MFEPEVITDLEQEPVSLSQARAWLKVNEGLTSEDEIITSCIKAARVYCERYTGLSFGPKTLKIDLPYTEYLRGYKLPYGPNIKVTGVYDADGYEVSLPNGLGSPWVAEYLKGMSVNNTWKEDYGWGGFGYDPLGAFEEVIYTVHYTAGYAAGKLPEDAIQAMRMLIADFYENRENTVVGTIVAELPLGVKALLNLLKPNVVFQ